RGDRQRDRYRARSPAPDFPAIPPSGRPPQPPGGRCRTRPGHCSADGRRTWRQASRGQPGGPRNNLQRPNPARLMNANILIIEDDPTLLRGLKDNFEFEGARVHIATDGQSGLDRALELRPDLIVLDLMLP